MNKRNYTERQINKLINKIKLNLSKYYQTRKTNSTKTTKIETTGLQPTSQNDASKNTLKVHFVILT